MIPKHDKQKKYLKNATSSNLKTSALQKHCYENKKRNSSLDECKKREGRGRKRREDTDI